VIADAHSWRSLTARDGAELERHYRDTLLALGQGSGLIPVIFRKAENKIRDPAKLRRLMDIGSDQSRKTHEIVDMAIGSRTKATAKKRWAAPPGVYRGGQPNHIERFNNTLCQRCSRIVRKTLSFSKKLANHVDALWYVIHDYNAQQRAKRGITTLAWLPGSVRCHLVTWSQLNLRHRLHHQCRTIRESLHLLAAGDAGEHEDSIEAALGAADDVGVHAVADHHRLLGVGAERAQRGAHH